MSANPMVERFEDWPRRLADFLDRAADRPFGWGTSDCCLFACDGVAAMTGVDLAVSFRGRYRTMAGAYRALKEFSGGAIGETAEIITASFELPEVPPRFAQRGDILLFHGCAPGAGSASSVDCAALALCLGSCLAAQAPEVGVQFGPLSLVSRAWRI